MRERCIRTTWTVMSGLFTPWCGVKYVAMLILAGTHIFHFLTVIKDLFYTLLSQHCKGRYPGSIDVYAIFIVTKSQILPRFIMCKRKRKRSDSVLWQKPLHQQKCQKGKVTTQTTPQKSSIKQRLRTDLGRSVGVTTATQLVWLTGLRAHLPTNRNSRPIKRTQVHCACSELSLQEFWTR